MSDKRFTVPLALAWDYMNHSFRGSLLWMACDKTNYSFRAWKNHHFELLPLALQKEIYTITNAMFSEVNDKGESA